MQWLVLVQVLALMTIGLADNGCAQPIPDEPIAPAHSSFALYTLSRGRGVPESAREALQQARAVLNEAKEKGTAVTLKQTRLGLEGETRLCAEFERPEDARTLLAQIREVVKGVELMNLVEEPCADR